MAEIIFTINTELRVLADLRNKSLLYNVMQQYIFKLVILSQCYSNNI